MSIQEMTESIKQIPGHIDAFKAAVPHFRSLKDWIFNGKELDPKAHDAMIAIGGMFVGTTDKQIKEYLQTNLWHVKRDAAGQPEKDENGKIIKSPGPLMEKIRTNPGMILDFVAKMEDGDLAKIIAENPELKAQLLEKLKASAPALTLSDLFAKNAGATASDQGVKQALEASFSAPKLEGLDTAEEIGEFFSYLPQAQVEEFIKTFKEKTDAASWTWDGVDIKINNFNDPEEVKRAITAGVKEAMPGTLSRYSKEDIFSGIREGIASSIKDNLDKMDAGTFEVPEANAAKFLKAAIEDALKAKNGTPADPQKYEELLDIISKKDGDKRLLDDKYLNLITVERLMQNKEALVNSYIPQGIAETLGSFKTMLASLDNLIPGLSKMIGQFVDAVIPMVEPLMNKMSAMIPGSNMAATG